MTLQVPIAEPVDSHDRLDGVAAPSVWPQTRAEFAVLVDAFKDRLVAHAFRRLGRIQEAEDVVQDVFVRLYAGLAQPRQVAHVTAYLFRMTTNACSDALRRRRYAPVSVEAIELESVPDKRRTPAEYSAALEETRQIEAWLHRLPRRQAAVLRLRFFDELRFAEIAEVLGCSVGTVKSRFRHGLQKLRRLMPDTREELP